MNQKNYLIKTENQKLQASSLTLVNEIAKLIAVGLGNSEDLSRYVRDHERRIAFDIDYAMQYIPQNHKILEVGSAPFLLTGALQKLGYNLCGLDFAPENMQGAIDRLGVNVIKCKALLTFWL